MERVCVLAFAKEVVSRRSDVLSCPDGEGFRITDFQDGKYRIKAFHDLIWDDSPDMPIGDIILRVHKRSGEIQLSNEMKESSDEYVFFFMAWAAVRNHTGDGGIFEADKFALECLLEEYPLSRKKFLIEFIKRIERHQSSENVTRIKRLTEAMFIMNAEEPHNSTR